MCISLGGFVFFKLNAVSDAKGAGDIMTRELAEQEKTESKVHGVASSAFDVSFNDVKENKNWNPMGDAVSAEKIKKWFSERGNYSFYGVDELSDYQTYDTETLTRLGDSGDLKAMHVLGDRASNFSELKNILMKAAAYGSTEALIQLGSLNENDEGNIGEKSAEIQKAKILTALAYYDVAQTRGDWWGNIAAGKSLTERYHIHISEQDKQLIEDLSEKIYQDLETRRSELGLGDFDNSVPDEVIKFYEEMLRPL